MTDGRPDGLRARSRAALTTGADARRVPGRRAIRALWLSSAAAAAGLAVGLVAIGWLALEVSDSALAVGATFAARFLPALVLGIPLGGLVDRYDRRRTMVVVDLSSWCRPARRRGAARRRRAARAGGAPRAEPGPRASRHGPRDARASPTPSTWPARRRDERDRARQSRWLHARVRRLDRRRGRARAGPGPGSRSCWQRRCRRSPARPRPRRTAGRARLRRPIAEPRGRRPACAGR